MNGPDLTNLGAAYIEAVQHYNTQRELVARAGQILDSTVSRLQEALKAIPEDGITVTFRGQLYCVRRRPDGALALTTVRQLT